MKRISIGALIALGTLFGLLNAGVTGAGTSQSETGPTGDQVRKICVMPFLKGRCPGDMKETLACNLSQLTFDPEKLSTNAEITLTRQVQEELRKRYGERMIPFPRVREAYDGILVDPTAVPARTLAKKLGENLGAPFVIVGTVWRYRERVGGAAGAATPASVAFGIHLMDVSLGKVIWRGFFDETQRALSEDILKAPAFFKRGAKWLSANELARFGVQKVLKKIPL